MGITIASQACLEILYLGLNACDGWIEIILYTSAFIVNRDITDENGVVHGQANGLSGESCGRGPVILSWQDVEQDSYTLHRGHNVIIHDFAHKLDMLSGRTDGQPPLTRDISLHEWSENLREGHAKLASQIEHH
jgi:Mlc titration factor MtfA (ptsG expression regulator)